MTVPATARKAGPFLGTGVITPLPFTFKVFEAADIVVTHIDETGFISVLALGDDYSVSLNPDQDATPGGTVTLMVALAVGEKAVLTSGIDYEQTLDLLAGGKFSPRAIEDAFDRTVIQIQQLAEQLDRTLQLPPTVDNDVSGVLPEPLANNLLGWNTAATALENKDPASFVSSVVYADWRTDTFAGDGVEDTFLLTADPGVVHNTDVAIDGVSQTPGDDYTLVAGALVFAEPPPNGTRVAARYGSALAAGFGSAGMISFIAAGAGAVQRTVESKLRDTISAKDFGVVGNGIADDTTPLQQAINAAAGKTLVLGAGHTYRITTELTIPHEMVLDGNGATINGSELPVGSALNQKRAIHVYGSIEAAVPVTASVAKGVRGLTVNTTGLAKDDAILIQSDEAMIPGYGNPASKRGQLALVGSVDSGTALTMQGSTEFSYDTAQNFRLQKVNMLRGVVIKNLEIVMKGSVSVHGGIRMDYCQHFLVDSVKMRGVEDHGLATWYCMDGVVQRCEVNDATSAYLWAPSLNTGYAYVFYNASRDIVLRDSVARNCRRANTGGNQLPAVFITVERNSAMYCDNAWGTHEPCFNWIIRDNYATGLAGVFITVRGSRHLIEGNRCVGSTGNGGIRVRTYYDDPVGLNHIHLIDNHLENTGGPGIWLEGIDIANEAPTGGLVGQVVIRGGSIINPESDGIYIQKTNHVLIDGVLFDGVRNAFATDGNGIYINGASDSWDRSSNITIRNCMFRGMLRNAVRADYCTKLTVAGCTIGGFTVNTTQSNGIYAYEIGDMVLQDNRVDMTVGYYGYHLENIDNLLIEGGSITGGSGLISQDLILIDHDAGGSGERNQNVIVRDITLEGSNRYGLFLRYCNDATVTGIYSATSGTINAKECNYLRLDQNNLTVSGGQLYNFRIEDCLRLLAASNYFHPGASTGAGIYCTRTAGKMEVVIARGNSFGAFPTGSAIILQDVNYPTITENNFVSVVGGNKVTITGDIARIVTNNFPGSVGLWKTDVTGTSVTMVSGGNYVGTNAALTTFTMPATPAVQSRLQVTVANGRTDNLIDRNGQLIMGLAENYTLDSPYAAPEFEFIGGSIGWRLTNV